jgi:hypothetical protein
MDQHLFSLTVVFLKAAHWKHDFPVEQSKWSDSRNALR